ncbi:unnamed protein product [Echinostoma caproni]|uniref:Uncharacterized protein n=1 Tax=Echinostoma caproni TaxID=27848 RepID=A0A3P8LE53_9TREM|nr:unnamed protein product [Echinostoma caproni]
MDASGYRQAGELTDEETGLSVSSASSNDEEDPMALTTSPESTDQIQSPEDLLAHQLSGQCHTSFDLTYWQELDDDPWSNNTTPMDYTNRLVAHLEEVVFDLGCFFLIDSQSDDRGKEKE